MSPSSPVALPIAAQPTSPSTALRARPEPVLSRVEGPVEGTSFANGRYQVEKFLGEGGKKKVYLALDTLPDRDVAFALIKAEGLDDVARSRIRRHGWTYWQVAGVSQTQDRD
jgi:hypothetical protein